MSCNRNDEGNIGQRLAKLYQQYALRVAYAKYKAEIYEQERQSSSMRGNSARSLKAQVAKRSWEVYLANLNEKKSELESAVKTALVGYNDTQRKVWFAYFFEAKSTDAISAEVDLSGRTVERMIARMKGDMEMKFTSGDVKKPPRQSKPKWSGDDLARFLEDKPSDDYRRAVQDMLDYGAVDIDALEFDHDFQEWLETGKRPRLW